MHKIVPFEFHFRIWERRPVSPYLKKAETPARQLVLVKKCQAGAWRSQDVLTTECPIISI